MRTLTSLLAALIVLAAPLVVQARGPSRSRGRVIPQKPIYFKPQTIQPNSPALIAARAESFDKLKADLNALAPRAAVTVEQKAQLHDDLLAVVDGSSKPATASVQKLSTDLASLLVKRSGPALNVERLARDLKTVMNSAYVPVFDVGKAIRDGHAALTTSGLGETDALLIDADLKAISVAAAAAGRPGMIR